MNVTANDAGEGFNTLIVSCSVSDNHINAANKHFKVQHLQGMDSEILW